MRLIPAIFGILLAFAPSVAAQVAAIPGSGCADGTSAGAPIVPVGQPQVGNLTFALSHQCQASSTAAFFLWGSCGASPLVDWNLGDSCFGSWASTPATCGNVIGSSLFLLDGTLTDGSGSVAWAFPIPGIPELVAFTLATPFCYQFICVELGVANPCRGVSQGLLVQITP